MCWHPPSYSTVMPEGTKNYVGAQWLVTASSLPTATSPNHGGGVLRLRKPWNNGAPTILVTKTATSIITQMPFHCDRGGASSTGKRKQNLELWHILLESIRKTSNYQHAEFLKSKQFLKEKGADYLKCTCRKTTNQAPWTTMVTLKYRKKMTIFQTPNSKVQKILV